MQVNKISNQNFGGTLEIPTVVKSELEQAIISLMSRKNQKLSTVPDLIIKLKGSDGILQITGKQEIINPSGINDFDVYIKKTQQNVPQKIENGDSLAERFLNGLQEVTGSKILG